MSPDGHCRSFDESSQGTVFGSGVGVVVLRRGRIVEEGPITATLRAPAHAYTRELLAAARLPELHETVS